MNCINNGDLSNINDQNVIILNSDERGKPYYTINKIIIKETMKIFCKGLYNKKYPQIKKRGTN